jgi:aromatic-amino-acid transaminase
MFFQNVLQGPPDAVFGMLGAFNADPRPNKVNLMVGIYKNEHLQNEIMPSVKTAIQEWTPTADYLPMDGMKELIDGLMVLIFGEKNERIYGAQALGGTGALRIGAELLAQEVGKNVFIPQHSWPNHRAIFERSQFHVETYPYYNRGFDLDACLAALKKMPAKSVVLWHAACHNPTGCDPTLAEWKEVAKVMREKQLLPFFDFAYQGLGEGLAEDAAAVRLFVKEGLECLVAYSCSKNFSLYSQRVGALFVISDRAVNIGNISSQVKRIIRAEYSNPPILGAWIVSRILKGSKMSWEQELTKMRERIQKMRRRFAEGLIQKKNRDFQHLLHHKGMFSFVDLEKGQVQKLIDQYAIYMLDNGRISVPGLNDQNVDAVVNAISQVMR